MRNQGAARREPSRHAQDLRTPLDLTTRAQCKRNNWDGVVGSFGGRGTAVPMVPASKCWLSCLSSAACHSG